MISNKIRIAGVLLVFAHLCHPFVLLTANIEDVKKIARKFVSEPMAQQIADFIQKAASQQGQLVNNPNVSEENEQNVEKMDSLSDNDALSKVQRQGPPVDKTDSYGSTSKRYRKLSRPTTASRQTPAQSYEPSSSPQPPPQPPLRPGPAENSGVQNNQKDRSFKKQQAELRQNIKKRWTPIQRDKTLYDDPATDAKAKQYAEEQIRQHQQLQQQLEQLQSKVPVGTIGDALEKMNANPKQNRFQKQHKQLQPQKPVQKKRIPKPYSDQQQYIIQPKKQQQHQYSQNQPQQNQYQPNQNQQNQYQPNPSKLSPKRQQKLPRYRFQKPQSQNQLMNNRNQQHQVQRQETNHQSERTIRQQEEPRQPQEPYEEEAEQSQYLKEQRLKTNENSPNEEQVDANQNESETNYEPKQKGEDQRNAEQGEEQKETEPEEEQKEEESDQTALIETTTSINDPEYQTPLKRRRTRSKNRGRFALQYNSETAPTMVIQLSPRNQDALELTTENEKNEFDQYDMKAPGLVATSGPVVLKAADWPDELPMARAQGKEEEGPTFQVAPVPARPPNAEDQDEKSTVVINLVANVEDETETPAETEVTANYGTDLGELGNLPNLI